MDSVAFSEWLSTLSPSSKIAALALIYSDLTVGARELFMPQWSATKPRCERATEILRGLNEVHHTISNQLVAYAIAEHKAFPVHAFSQMLAEIEGKYQLQELLAPAIQFAQTRSLTR